MTLRHALLGFLIATIPLAGIAGPIAKKYAIGFDGTSWGDSVAEVVAKHPGGEHFFASGGSTQREYSVLDERPMFGIARTHMRNYYFFDETDSVLSVALTFPIEQRQLLMGLLTASFGPARLTETKGISTTYAWATDDGTSIGIRETLDPRYGILTLMISGPNANLGNLDAQCVPLPRQHRAAHCPHAGS